MRIAKALLIVAGLSLLVTGCGVRGPLEAPPGEKTTEGVDGKGLVKEEQKPHRPFILDGLLD